MEPELIRKLVVNYPAYLSFSIGFFPNFQRGQIAFQETTSPDTVHAYCFPARPKLLWAMGEARICHSGQTAGMAAAARHHLRRSHPGGARRLHSPNGLHWRRD